MIRFFLILSLGILYSCAKPKTVLICGDHVCINKKEAKQFFEENLSLEVKIIDKNKKNRVDLVQLNLKENKKGKQVEIIKKNKTKKNLKILSDDEIEQIKIDIKKKDKNKELIKKNNAENEGTLKVSSDQNDGKKNKIIYKKNKIMQQNNIIDVCKILDNCTIEEISKYLIQLGKKKNFPDITIRE